MQRSFLFLALLSQITLCYSQGVKGRLTDKKNAPVPFAAVYDEVSYVGTTCNADGYYDLKLEPGKHSLVFKALGYYMERRQITTSNQSLTINIQLEEQAVELKEVVVTPGKEDPAYAIMRKVISMAPYHLNQVKEYKADVYLRGTIRIINIPKIIAKRIEIDGKKNMIKNGDVYLEESINQLQFKAPDRYEQKVISFRSTFPGENKDVNPMNIIRSSFYQPKIDETISPLAPNAFSFYKYRYEGYFNEGENVIFKIKVLPKHNSQQLLTGYIYIVDKLWCLHSVDASQKMFFGTLSYKAVYSPVKDNAWLPISYQIFVDAGIMGIKANYKYSSSVKFQQVVLNEKGSVKPVKTEVQVVAPKKPPQTKAEIKKQKNQEAMEKLMTKDNLTNRDMVKLATLMSKDTDPDTSNTKSLEIKDYGANKVTIEKDALKNDTAYWNTMRPVPLTAVETKLTGKRDSIRATSKDTIAAKDTTHTKKQKKQSKLARFLFDRSGFWMFDSTLRFNYEGLIGLGKFDFNTVDGFIYRQTFSLEQRIDSAHRLRINPGIAYAFSREKVMGWADLNYNYAPRRGGNLHFHIASESADYNESSGIDKKLNTLTCLFFRRNYLTLYHQNHAYLSNRIDLANGLIFSAKVGYRTAQPPENHSDFSFFYHNEREYWPNYPENNPVKLARNVYNEEAYWDVKLEFTPQYYYRMWGNRKHYERSKYPTIYIHNRMAVPSIFSSTADYDLLETGVRQKKEWGLMHAFSWDIKGGFFLNRNKLFLMDDKYFNNQDLPVTFGNASDAFRLVPYYRNSTTRNFAEAHVQFTTPYLLIKYLPFLSNKLWCENLHMNFLTTKEVKNYWEAGYSISQIYLVGSIGVFAGFKGTSFQTWGIKASFIFD